MNLLNMICTIYRSTSIADDHRTERTEVASGVACMLIPSDSETAAAENIELSRAYDVFFESGTDVKVSDKIVVDGVDYYISGKQGFKNAGNVSHVRCIAEIADVKE